MVQIFSVVLLSACAPAPEDTGTVEETAATGAIQAAAPVEQADTVEYLMTETIMPSADQIWRSVSYVANAQGVTETRPETDEDWAQLRASALALIDAGDELMDTKREIFSGEFDQATESFQYSPGEIRQLLAENPEPWQDYIGQMQDMTRMTLQAIELKDLVGLQDFGAQINRSCEGCHADYWYRPPVQ